MTIVDPMNYLGIGESFLDDDFGLSPIQRCPRCYIINVKVVTRAGDIPIPGVLVKINGQTLGVTDQNGDAGQSGWQDATEILVEAIYENAAHRLKNETFRLQFSQIDDAGNYVAENSTNTIKKIRDVLGAGTSSLEGDVDFEDTYPTDANQINFNAVSKKYEIVVKMATLSWDVPYSNQLRGDERFVKSRDKKGNPITHPMKGWDLCMPTSFEMLLAYWGIRRQYMQILPVPPSTDLAEPRLEMPTRPPYLEGIPNDFSTQSPPDFQVITATEPYTRLLIMQGVWDASKHQVVQPATKGGCPWQRWDEVKNWVKGVCPSELDAQFDVRAGLHSIPSEAADDVRDRLVRAEPIVCGIVGGHVILLRGVVVWHDLQVRWLIANDPYGTLSGPNSIYAKLNLAESVGDGGVNNVDDVSAVQDVLRYLGHYNEDITGTIDATDDSDATVQAIKDYQASKKIKPNDGLIEPSGTTRARLQQDLTQRDDPWYSGYMAKDPGPEKEKNTEREKNLSGVDVERGRHVYYNGETECRGSAKKFLFSGQVKAIAIIRTPEFMLIEKVTRLTPGQKTD